MSIQLRFLSAILLLLCGCNASRHVQDGKYLLEKVIVKSDNPQVSIDDINSYIKQKPNRKVLVFKFHLWAYNFALLGDTSKFDKWIISTIGEEPVVMDNLMTSKSVKQIELYMRNKGYFRAQVSDSVVYNKNEKKNKKRVSVEYNIKSRELYTVDSINYFISDSIISSIVLNDTSNALIKNGKPFDVELLQSERNRITTNLRNLGYYTFIKEFIWFEADSTGLPFKIKLDIKISSDVEKDDEKTIKDSLELFKKYYINTISIYNNYDPRKALAAQDSYLKTFDIVIFSVKRCPHCYNVNLLTDKPLKIRPDVITKQLVFHKDSLYRAFDIDDTYRRLSSLGVYKSVNVILEDITPQNYKHGLLNCNIQLVPTTLQSYRFGIEGTNSSANTGVSGNIVYSHKNIFHGAENLTIRLKGALEAQKDIMTEKSVKRLNTTEYDAEIRLNIPKFMLPFKSFVRSLEKQYAPKTSIVSSYNYQNRPDYTRTIANFTYGYYWQTSDYVTHLFNPLVLDVVRLPKKDSLFVVSIQGLYIKHSFEDHVIASANYSYIYTDQDAKKRKKNFYYFRLNSEIAGNLLYAYYKGTNQPLLERSYTIFGTQFAQYVKGDFDFRHYHRINDNQLVYRIFAGAGLPYGNVKTMPFGKKYFSGGAYSLRAWDVRTVGPGAYADTLEMFPNSSADVKLEANLEYRFKMFWIIEGALFVDAGNIWAINSYDNRPGAKLIYNKFYKQIATGTGFGIRIDLSFFVFRLDFGLKITDPQLPEGKRFVWLSSNDVKKGAFSVAIGYPF